MSRLAPWRRRIVVALAAFVLLVAGGSLLGVRIHYGAFAALLLAVFSLGWFLVDHQASNRAVLWPLSDLYRTQGFRGSDFRTTNLTARIAEAQRGTGRDELVRDLHARLSAIVAARLMAKHGLRLDEEPDLAKGLTPEPLWRLVTEPPPPDLYTPATLDRLMTELEKW